LSDDPKLKELYDRLGVVVALKPDFIKTRIENLEDPEEID